MSFHAWRTSQEVSGVSGAPDIRGSCSRSTIVVSLTTSASMRKIRYRPAQQRVIHGGCSLRMRCTSGDSRLTKSRVSTQSSGRVGRKGVPDPSAGTSTQGILSTQVCGVSRMASAGWWRVLSDIHSPPFTGCSRLSPFTYCRLRGSENMPVDLDQLTIPLAFSCTTQQLDPDQYHGRRISHHEFNAPGCRRDISRR